LEAAHIRHEPEAAYQLQAQETDAALKRDMAIALDARDHSAQFAITDCAA
jgi:hypothetical protein